MHKSIGFHIQLQATSLTPSALGRTYCVQVGPAGGADTVYFSLLCVEVRIMRVRECAYIIMYVSAYVRMYVSG